MGVKAVALLWGFAEATLFFIVPDVWLTLLARERLRPALIASLYSLAGALAGGSLMYLWGRGEPQAARAVLELIPAIGPAMIERVRDELSGEGVLAVLLGPLSGTPYKIYATQAAQAGIGAGTFLLISVPARLGRFLLVTLLAHLVLRGVVRRWPGVNRVAVLLGGWALFYAGYFSLMPG